MASCRSVAAASAAADSAADLACAAHGLIRCTAVGPWLHLLLPASGLSLPQLRESTMASTRLRAAVVAEAMSERGWQVSVGDRIAPLATHVLIGKIGSSDIARRAPVWLMQLHAARAAGAQLWLDYTDHHLGFDSPMRRFYADVLPLIDVAVVPSPAMQQQLAQYWKGRIAVVVDALDVPVLPPKVRTGSTRQTALWFGHARNAPYLLHFLMNNSWLADELQVLALTDGRGMDILANTYRGPTAPIALHCLPWSPQVTIDAAAVADLVLIPSDLADPRKSGASANRLVTALALGLPVAADVLPAYAPYRQYFADLRSAQLPALLRDPGARCDVVREAQQVVVPRYTKPAVAAEWVTVLDPRLNTKEICRQS